MVNPTHPQSVLLTPDFEYCDTDGEYPTVARGWVSNRLSLAASGTHYGFIFDGTATLETGGQVFTVQSGYYFCAPREAVLYGKGCGIVVTRVNFEGLFSLGGPIETFGRLKYIDGCTDTVLIHPTIVGDPCLNLLTIPPGSNQTRHTHPTIRIGIVVDGEGSCRTQHDSFALQKGHIFILPHEAVHSFHTSDSQLRIVVYHPDTDTGPSHDNHPMLNRTEVNGESAKNIHSIRTK